MRHYRCRTCEAEFSVEPLDGRDMPGSVTCVFCGEPARTTLEPGRDLSAAAQAKRRSAGLRR